MSVLDKVGVVEGAERRQGYDPVRVRRRKLAAGLADQMRLLEAVERGQAYRKVKVHERRDLETDERVPVEESRRVAPWWWVDDDGGVRFSLRYGSVRLVIKDGMDAIVLGNLDELKAILPPLRQEVLTGGWDEALNDAAHRLYARFSTKKAAKAKSG